MVLADLDALEGSSDFGRRGGIPGLRESAGDLFGGVGDSLVGIDGRDAGQDGVDAAAREGPNRLVTADLAELAHGGRGQIVVGVLELGPAGRGEAVALGRSAPADVLPGRRGLRLGVTAVDQCVKVAADSGGGNAEFGADFGGRDRPRLHEQPHDLPAGLTVLRRNARYGRILGQQFHNTSVTEFNRPV